MLTRFPSVSMPKPGEPDVLLELANTQVEALENPDYPFTSAVQGELTTYRNRFVTKATEQESAYNNYNALKMQVDEAYKAYKAAKEIAQDTRENMYHRAQRVLAGMTLNPDNLELVGEAVQWAGGQYFYSEPAAPIIEECVYANSKLFVNWKDGNTDRQGAVKPELYYVCVDGTIAKATDLTESWFSPTALGFAPGQHMITVVAESGAGGSASEPELISW